MNNDLTKLENICLEKLVEKGLDTPEYRARLQAELTEVSNQMKISYFLDLYEKKLRFKQNEFNLLLVFLLGLCKEFDMSLPSEFAIGDFPDCDLDYIDVVGDYIKNDWAVKTFGIDRVCAIGSYSTFGIKGSLIDMARVYSKSHTEIKDLTTKIGLKDDDGKAITWDKAMEMYPDLKKYCDENPDVAIAAKKLLHRNRGTSTHAAGLVIANQSIDNLVPIMTNKDGVYVSAFVEGLHGTDLGPLGLIKQDVLRLKNLKQIGWCIKLVKERHELKHVCALPGQGNWSDTSYMNDPAALKIANDGHLSCIFQFDSQGMQNLVTRGGVDSFGDLVAYSSLYRPGPLSFKLDERYVERKRGREKYELHPVLEPILGKTYGVACYQEQIMQILNVVGKIPLIHCEIIRKAISKKKVEIFGEYKEMFVINGQEVLGWVKEQLEEMWQQLEAWSEYGFNKSHAVAYTAISSRLLYLKAHYPLEFFAAILSCEEDTAKVKMYIQEARKFGVNVERVNLNKSKTRFDIVDDKVYMGIADIKGVGVEIAGRVVGLQPYASVEDYLDRFGVDMKVAKPFIALNMFDEYGETDRNKLFEYYLHYKKRLESEKARVERFEKKKKEVTEDVRFLLPEEKKGLAEQFLEIAVGLDKENFKQKCKSVLNGNTDAMWEIVGKFSKSHKRFHEHGGLEVLALKEFEPTGVVPKDAVKTVDLLKAVPQVAEMTYFGFLWRHLLEDAEQYKGGHTFEDFERDEMAAVRMCEVHIVEHPKELKSKKGMPYYIITVEDANSKRVEITFWQDDYERFKDELNYWEDDFKKGHFLKIRLKKPDGNFRRYTFDAPPKPLRWKVVPKNKVDDFRLQVMI